MKRVILLAVIALALVLAAPGTAWASVSSLTLDGRASLSASKTSAIATGTIVCSAGNEAEISVVILQSSGKVDAAAQGSGTVTCTGTVQPWAVVTDVVIGSAFKHGPATAIFSAFDVTDSDSFPTQTQGIKL